MDAVDTEQIKKVNLMVKELQKHGFADSSDTATELAYQMYTGDKPASSNEDNRFANFERRMEQKTESAVRGLVVSNAGMRDELQKLWDAVGRMNREILNLASSRAEAKAEARAEPVVKIIDPEYEAQAEAQVQSSQPVSQARAVQPVQQQVQEQKEGNNGATVSRPRFGNYTSDDVSVEKFFYFGKK